MLKEIHERCGGDHAGFRAVVRKALKVGYFWPTMMRDAKDLVMKYDGPLIHVPTEELGALYSPCPFAKWGCTW